MTKTTLTKAQLVAEIARLKRAQKRLDDDFLNTRAELSHSKREGLALANAAKDSVELLELQQDVSPENRERLAALAIEILGG